MMKFPCIDRWVLALVAAGVVTLGPSVAAGQEPDGGRGALSGSVVDLADGTPLGLARVILVPVPAGILPVSAAESAYLAGSRSLLTDRRGAYQFADVVPGHYRLYVRRIGYRQATLDLELPVDGLHLSLGMTVAPIRLRPVTATSAPVDMFEGDVAGEPQTDWDRAARERWRQSVFLESDVRAISDEEVLEAITLGESDILRALQRSPGVTTRDDWTAAPWVRGAPADHTRVLFDGMPVFNPTHAGGLSTAINADALGAVFLYPGVRAPSMAAGASGVVDMRTRSAGGTGKWRGRGGLSSSNLHAAIDRRWNDGRVGTVLAIRRSWLDRRRDLVRDPRGVSAEIPNDYADVVGRVDVDLGDGRGVEVSGLWERDWIDGGLRGGPGNRSAWGNTVGRATLQLPFMGGYLRQTAGASRFDAEVRQFEPLPPLAAFDPIPTQEPTDNELLYLTLNAEWTRPAADGRGPEWRLGYHVFHERVHYVGAPPNPFSIPVYLYTLRQEEQVTAFYVQGERWWWPADRLVLRTGVRIEVDPEVWGTGLLDPGGLLGNSGRISPQLSLRYNVSDRFSFSIATGSHYQYEHPLATAGLRFGPSLSTGPLWLLAENAASAMRTEINTAGAEYWLDDVWLATVNYYDRSTENVQIPDPGPGPVEDDEFAVGATNDANGIELQLRRLVGQWTASWAYTFSVSDYRARGERFPAPTDRRHVVDATLMTRVADLVAGGTLRLGGVLTAASGTPFTRLHPGWYDCSNYVPGGHCDTLVPTFLESPNAERAPWTSGINVLIDWSRSFRAWHLAAHVQVQNLVNAPRATTYAVDDAACRRPSASSAFCNANQDAFVPGLRRHYEFGVRFAF